MAKSNEDETRMSERSDYGKLAEACESGDQLAALRQLRQDLAWSIENGPVTVVAQTAARLQAVLVAVATLEASSPERSASDDIARELAGGLADSKVVQLTGRGRKRRTG